MKSKCKIFYHFNDPLYKTGISFFIGGDQVQAIVKWSKYWGFDIEDIEDRERQVQAVAAFTMFPKIDSPVNAAMVWVPKVPRTPSDYALLAHETLHVTLRCLSNFGIDRADDEAYCYYHEWLMCTILTRVQKNISG